SALVQDRGRRAHDFSPPCPGEIPFANNARRRSALRTKFFSDFFGTPRGGRPFGDCGGGDAPPDLRPAPCRSAVSATLFSMMRLRGGSYGNRPLFRVRQGGEQGVERRL